MRLGLLCFLSARLLMRSRLSAILLVLAVALGIGFQIPNSANLNGYTEELIQQGVLRATGDVLVTPRQGIFLDGATALRGRLAAVPGVRQVVARSFHAGVMLRDVGSRAVRLVAIDPGDEDRATELSSRIVQGRLFAADEQRRVLLGARLAKSLELGVGDTFKLVVPVGAPADPDPKTILLHVVAVLASGGGFSEDNDLVMNMATAEKELAIGDRASVILVYGWDHARAGGLADGIRRTAPEVVAQSWQEIPGLISQAIRGNRKLALVSTAMGMISVAVPVLALLFVHVFAERKQIAIVRALGLGVMEIFIVYFLKSLWIAVPGIALGAGLGIGVCAYFQRSPIFQSDGFVVHPSLHVVSIVVPCLVVLATVLLAGVAPAVVAGRTDPIRHLKGE